MEEEKKEEVQTEVSTTPVVEENKQPNKKGNKTLILVIIVIAIALICGGVLFLSNGSNGDKEKDTPVDTPKDEEPKDDEPVSNEKKELSDENITLKLKNFVDIASYEDSNENGEAELFMKGTSNIDNKVKLQLVWNSLINIKKVQTKIGSDVPEKYKDVVGISEKEEIKTSQFDSEYSLLFNENPNYTEEVNFGGCPGIYKIDKELGIIIIGTECGGENPTDYYSKIYKYEEDNSYYYVSQYVGKNDPINNKLLKVKSGEVVDVSAFDGNENKFETVVWKFDKNFSFISTENIG